MTDLTNVATRAVAQARVTTAAKLQQVEAAADSDAGTTVLAAILPHVLQIISDTEADVALSIEPLWDQKQAILAAVKEGFGL